MIINGEFGSGKTTYLIDKYVELVLSKYLPHQILVICQNKHKQNAFTEAILNKLLMLGIDKTIMPNIRTFNGIVYNFILDNWAFIESKISKLDDKSEILPVLCGLETTEYLLRNTINKINNRHDIEKTFRDYPSPHNLLHQILRRYSLIIQNNLNDDEIKKAVKILNEEYYYQVEESINLIKKHSLIYRHLDYLRQTQIFSGLFEDKFDYFNHIKCLIVDDYDELPLVAQNFTNKIIHKSSDFYVGVDMKGGSRRGYLCAYPEGIKELTETYPNLAINLELKSKLKKDAENLYNSIKDDSYFNLENIRLESYLWRADMIKSSLNKIKEMLGDGKKPDDIIIVAPDFDICLKYSIQEFFEQNNIDYQFFSGSKKLIDDKMVKSIITIAQLININWNLFPSKSELAELFSFLFGYSIAKTEIYKNKINYKNFKKISFGIEELDEKFSDFLLKTDEIKEQNLDLYEQLGEIFSKFILPIIDEKTSLYDFNNLLKSLRDFKSLIKKIGKNIKDEEKDWVIQIKSTVVSDNPAIEEEIKENVIKIATPQKVIDLELRSKYQIWLDVSSNSWIKDDTGPLYNSWVLRKNYKFNDYSPEIHKKLTLEKSAHLIRKLVLCANKKIYCFASNLDSSGRDNAYGGISLYINSKLEENKCDFNFNPRDDQKDIFNYKGGLLAVPAVPGAGKTTVMQGLIHKLITSGVEPSKILVLTYMDSAAENIKEKVKSFCSSEVPHVSTIHSLALKILKENDNYSKLGLEYDFNICDGDLRPQIINEKCGIYLPAGEDFKKWQEMINNGITYAKQNGIIPQKIQKNTKNSQIIKEFFDVYKDYQDFLKQRNMIDFDDILYLCLKLLEEFKDVREFYQDKFTYIIEDEAQDSSEIQQKIMTLISAKSKNLIRCGDVNQAITTTFSNADVEGFKNFITNNHKVEMDCSQRCAEGIYTFANNLIKFSKESEVLSDAFYEIYMKPVINKNPTNKDNLYFNIFESAEEEKDYILNKIKKLKVENPDLSIAILLRNNFQVLKWANLLESNELPFICKTDSLKQKKVFKFLLTFLKFLVQPYDNKRTVELFTILTNYKLYKREFKSFNFLNSIGSPFLSFKLNELPTDELIRFKLDLEYWIHNSALPIEELIIKLGHYYFMDTLDRANVHLFTLFVKKYREKETDYNKNNTIGLFEIVKYFEEIERKDIKVKYFEEESDNIKGQTCVMTVHKSKGLGFDVVFMPAMHEDGFSYSITPEKSITSSKHKLMKELNKLISKNIDYSDYKNKILQCHEHLRLIYVGITRAKQQLFMTSHYNDDNGSYVRENMPSEILQHFIDKDELKNWRIYE